MLRTKIVCTTGPASRAPDMLRGLIAAGMDVARINFSHGDQAQHEETIERIRTAAAEVGRPVSILADLQGPKLRVGRMENGGVPLETGEEVVLTTRPIVGQRGEVPVQY
ncbi:MAG: pyruvate kinase, partial [Chloroflexota bacterium]|nr:pyruvate kinase [Chloroflexota bacterium]